MDEPLRHRRTKGAATRMLDLTPPRHIDGQRCGTSALLGALSSELDQPLSIERGKLHTAELSLERCHHRSAI